MKIETLNEESFAEVRESYGGIEMTKVADNKGSTLTNGIAVDLQPNTQNKNGDDWAIEVEPGQQLPQVLQVAEMAALSDTEINQLNKTSLFDVLVAAGITEVTVTFDGYGDNGQVGEKPLSRETPTRMSRPSLSRFTVSAASNRHWQYRNRAPRQSKHCATSVSTRDTGVGRLTRVLMVSLRSMWRDERLTKSTTGEKVFTETAEWGNEF